MEKTLYTYLYIVYVCVDMCKRVRMASRDSLVPVQSTQASSPRVLITASVPFRAKKEEEKEKENEKGKMRGKKKEKEKEKREKYPPNCGSGLYTESLDEFWVTVWYLRRQVQQFQREVQSRSSLSY